jgi:hypothetical protein
MNEIKFSINSSKIKGVIKRSVRLSAVLAAFSVLVSACAWKQPIWTPQHGTELTGNNVQNLPSFYGKYRLAGGSLGVGIAFLEIQPNKYGKPLFSFLDENGVIVRNGSPTKCVIDKGPASVYGSITCGRLSFPQIPSYFSLTSAVHMKDAGPNEYSGIVEAKIVPFKPNWYSFLVSWGYPERSVHSALEKIN